MTNLPNKARLTPSEVAAYYSVSRSAVYEWINSGKLKAVKVAGKTIRIPREALKDIEADVSE